MEYHIKGKVEFNPLYYGILAGIAAGIIQSIYERPLVWFHIIDSGILEHAKVVMMGSKGLNGYIASLVGMVGHLLYSGLCGGAFALVVTKYPGHEYFMGTGVGLTAWITIMFITTSLHKHTGGQEEAHHALMLLVGGAIYGLATAWIFKRFAKKFG